jgi:hypothetical protein
VAAAAAAARRQRQRGSDGQLGGGDNSLAAAQCWQWRQQCCRKRGSSAVAAAVAVAAQWWRQQSSRQRSSGGGGKGCANHGLEIWKAAPICTGGLRGKFGYNTVTRTARAILNRTYKFPPDFDQDTREICKECARIWEMVPIDSLDTIITKEEWRCQWKGCHESTSSLELGLHFGHYITALCSNHASYFHALKAILIIWRSVVLERWACGLSIMLKKMFGCVLITKLWSIPLMEADFNATNKIIYGQQMLHQVRKYKLIPEEIYSK